ncbi:hypothetical protein I7I48_04194 [Histoplasma ohiense]|nr:hypothetical protein I7I48_04194 [Histoplasma ohiense (nom. inval.)]
MMQRCTACEPFKAVEIWGIRPQLDAKILSVKITYGVCRMTQSLRRSKWPRRGQPAILMFSFLHSSGRIMFRVRFMRGERVWREHFRVPNTRYGYFGDFSWLQVRTDSTQEVLQRNGKGIKKF